MPQAADTKAQWRRRLRERAAAEPVDPAAQLDLTDALAAFLAEFPPAHPELPPPASASLVLMYLSMPTEPALEPLAERLGRERFAVTRTPESGPLTIHPATAELERHRYGFMQPSAGAPRLPEGRVGVALVPGLAFDRRGNRLGRGAGYYDELLPRLAADCLRVGVAFERDVVEALPTEPHDVVMTHLATERGVVAVAG